MNTFSSPVRILGLGRCVIGHMAKYLNTHEPDLVSFNHRYLLNYDAYLESASPVGGIDAFEAVTCMPPLSDQFRALDGIETYDVCAIEIFPPSGLYRHRSEPLFACFESFTDELEALGFHPLPTLPLSPSDAAERFARTLQRLVETLRKRNQALKMILVNGELTRDSDRPEVGSAAMDAILRKLRTLPLLHEEGIALLDMNRLINRLQRCNAAFFETAFPYLYLSHTPDLEIRGVFRDCKHTTASIRLRFLGEFCALMGGFGLNAPRIALTEPEIAEMAPDFLDRARRFFAAPAALVQPAHDFEDPRKFSVFVSYAFSTAHQEAYRIIREYIADFAKRHPANGADLKNRFYHLRTLCAFVYSVRPRALADMCRIGLSILALPEKERQPYTNFALLWLTDLYLASRALLPDADREEMDIYREWIDTLRSDKNLQHHTPVQKIVGDAFFTKDF